jgi:hypothetical protein
MPVKKTLIGTSTPKKVYIDTAVVKLIYVDAKCVYADPIDVIIGIREGVRRVYYTVTEKDGSVFSGIVTSTSDSETRNVTIQVGYGAVIEFTDAEAWDEYKLTGSYQYTSTVTRARSYTFMASKVASDISADMVMVFSDDNRPHRNMGTYKYSIDGGQTWKTVVSSSSRTITIDNTVGEMQLKVLPECGFVIDSVTNRNTTIISEDDIYYIKVTKPASPDIRIKLKESSSYEGMVISAELPGINKSLRLKRKGWHVKVDQITDCAIPSCPAYTVLYKIPTRWLPESKQEVANTSWTYGFKDDDTSNLKLDIPVSDVLNSCTPPITNPGSSRATITFEAGGNIYSSEYSTAYTIRVPSGESVTWRSYLNIPSDKVSWYVAK